MHPESGLLYEDPIGQQLWALHPSESHAGPSNIAPVEEHLNQSTADEEQPRRSARKRAPIRNDETSVSSHSSDESEFVPPSSRRPKLRASRRHQTRRASMLDQGAVERLTSGPTCRAASQPSEAAAAAEVDQGVPQDETEADSATSLTTETPNDSSEEELSGAAAAAHDEPTALMSHLSPQAPAVPPSRLPSPGCSSPNTPLRFTPAPAHSPGSTEAAPVPHFSAGPAASSFTAPLRTPRAVTALPSAAAVSLGGFPANAVMRALTAARKTLPAPPLQPSPPSAAAAMCTETARRASPAAAAVSRDAQPAAAAVHVPRGSGAGGSSAAKLPHERQTSSASGAFAAAVTSAPAVTVPQSAASTSAIALSSSSQGSISEVVDAVNQTLLGMFDSDLIAAEQVERLEARLAMKDLLDLQRDGIRDVLKSFGGLTHKQALFMQKHILDLKQS